MAQILADVDERVALDAPPLMAANQVSPLTSVELQPVSKVEVGADAAHIVEAIEGIQQL